MEIVLFIGELGLALYVFFFSILPAKKASRPASTAFFIAEAINIGFPEAAIAVFISTPSQPSSIAMVASEAVPTPASTITGIFALLMIICKFHGFRIHIPEPINDANGIIATQPISSSCFATIGSSEVYTIT